MANIRLIEVTIGYPERPGFILQAYQIQQEIMSLFRLPARLEDRKDGKFTVVLNGTTLYESLPENTSKINLQKIISAVSAYKKPVSEDERPESETDDSNDPEYQQWMNCICSGE